MALDPTTISFTTSADHNTNNTDGSPKVKQYRVQLYESGQLRKEASLGKPTATAGAMVTVSIERTLYGLGVGPFSYRVGAEGSTGAVTWGGWAADTITRSGSTGVPAAPGQPTVS